MHRPEIRVTLDALCPLPDNSLRGGDRVPVKFVPKPVKGYDLNCINLTPDNNCAPTARTASDGMPLSCPVAADLFVSGRQEGEELGERVYHTRAGRIEIDFENGEIISAPSWEEGTAPRHVPPVRLWMLRTLLDAQGRLVEEVFL